uniref:Uncharacterized protein n=1 Tax=Chaetoceros debilis TaxID=122233 RepID=A0A7S3PU73_9STRA
MVIFPPALRNSQVTVLGYGALLSESSSRLTFPNLSNFRHVRIKGFRRVFAHPHVFLIGEELVHPDRTSHLASLSAERILGDKDEDERMKTIGSYSFVAAAFKVTLDDAQRMDFIRREPEYEIVSTPFFNLDTKLDQDHPVGEGVICIASHDSSLDFDNFPMMSKVSDLCSSRGGIWHWPHDSGLLPADIYLRHCLLAVKKAGGDAYDSFLKDTYLADRITTLATYLKDHGDDVLSSRPPPHLSNRFGG